MASRRWPRLERGVGGGVVGIHGGRLRAFCFAGDDGVEPGVGVQELADDFLIVEAFLESTVVGDQKNSASALGAFQ